MDLKPAGRTADSGVVGELEAGRIGVGPVSKDGLPDAAAKTSEKFSACGSLERTEGETR